MIIVFLLSLSASWLLLRFLIPRLSLRFLDLPNVRSSHSCPIPRGGGVAFVLVAVIACIIELCLIIAGKSVQPRAGNSGFPVLYLSLFALPLAVVGFLDDRHNLSAGIRYFVQLATSILLILVAPLTVPLFNGIRSSSPLYLLLSLAAGFFLLISATALINFINFMDGVDGMVAGCMVIVIGAAAIQLSTIWVTWALLGALLGFLIWNWSPAKVFMGDVGSTFLGALFAGLVLQAPTWPGALGLLLVATPLLGDACFCVLRRLLAGQNVLQAHRLHLFQRLHQAGLSHARVSSLYIAGTAVLAGALLIGGWPWVVTFAIVQILVGVWLDQNVAVPFAVASVGVEVP